MLLKAKIVISTQVVTLLLEFSSFVQLIDHIQSMKSCCGNGAFIFSLGMKFNDNLCQYLANLSKSHGVFFSSLCSIA
jgi:hypothetical protein